jgi:hypothetical protein
MKYVANLTQQKTLEAQGWTLLFDLLTKANLTEAQWLSINLALGFPVMADKKDQYAECL